MTSGGCLSRWSLFAMKRVDRVEVGSVASWVVAKEDSDRHRERKTAEDRGEGKLVSRFDVRTFDATRDATRTSPSGKHTF